MVKYLIILTLVLGVSSENIIGQTIVPIQTDRPDQTECPFIVPIKHFQLETGFNYEKLNRNESNILYWTALLKYGVNVKSELRLITEVITVNNSGNKFNGINPVKIGFKTKLFDEKGVLPTTSFIAHLSVPSLSTKKFRTTFFAPDFRFTMQHSLSNTISLGYNLGAEWDGETANPTFIYTLTCGFSLLPKVGTYIELYGFAPQRRRAEHRCDGGITYFIKPNLMVDISGSFRLTANASAYYAALGFSVRMPD